MASDERLVVLRHGTTKQRAEAILRLGPDPNYQEPGSSGKAEGFSTARIQAAYPYGSPEACAVGKAQIFANEGGPAIVEIEVPESIVAKADLGGEVRFEPGFGLEELLAMWSSLAKRIVEP
jgi:hypothetical protein